MNDLTAMQEEIEKINQRNKNVEADKAWETSAARKIILAILTWLAIGIYLTAIKVDRPWINSIVPAVGFMLSTLTLGYFKKYWLKKIYQKTK